MMKQITKAWAIKMKISGHPKPNFMGVFYFARLGLADWHDGMRSCLFRTRKQARDALRSLTYRKDEHVVRVKVVIEEVR